MLTFGDILNLNLKNKFYRHRSPIFLKDGDIEKVLVPKEISSGEKKLDHCI